MGWIDKLQNKFIITCGNGNSYTPLWKNSSQELEWNIAEFNFPGVDGTLVKKSKPIGRKFPLEFFFQGDNHLDEAADFDISANDPRPWTIEHPYYGTIIVQVPQLSRNNSEHNVTIYTGTAIETITEDNPKVSFDPLESIQINKIALDETAELILTKPVTADDIVKLKDVSNKSYKQGLKIITIPTEFEEYTNVFHQANAAVNTATASPLLAMRATVSFLTMPAKFTASVEARLNLLVNQFNILRQTLVGLVTVGSKQIYQIQAGTFISSMCLAAATPQKGNYTNSKSALKSIQSIVDNFNLFLADLDSLQNDNGGNPLSFIPDATGMFDLGNLISLTISNLYAIALSARLERTLYLEADTNIIELTHRLYGLDQDDNNINEMLENNGWGLEQYFQIKKGTLVRYYI